MIVVFSLFLLIAPPSHYLEQWRTLRNPDCGRLLFLASRLQHHRHIFSPHDVKRIDFCKRKLFPGELLNLRSQPPFIGLDARGILANHETPSRVYVPAGVWYIGFVPYLVPFARKLHAQLPAPGPHIDFSFGMIVRREPFWIETKEHSFGDSSKPMVRVTFEEARAICKKLGGDLPDEDQWEIAARGTEYYRQFSFGESVPPVCVGRSGEACGSLRETVDISPWGVWHMGSGVAEWVLPSSARSVVPTGMAITRGGSSRDSYFWNLVPVRRIVSSQTRSQEIGFRCAWPHLSRQFPR